MHWLVEIPRTLILHRLLTIDTDVTDNDGRTPLDLAKEKGRNDIVDYLKTQQESSPGKL